MSVTKVHGQETFYSLILPLQSISVEKKRDKKYTQTESETTVFLSSLDMGSHCAVVAVTLCLLFQHFMSYQIGGIKFSQLSQINSTVRFFFKSPCQNWVSTTIVSKPGWGRFLWRFVKIRWVRKIATQFIVQFLNQANPPKLGWLHCHECSKVDNP